MPKQDSKTMKSKNWLVEDIAAMVVADLDFLDVEELWDRSGPSRYGYVEIAEEACEMVEEAIQSFLDEAMGYLESGAREQAMSYCEGIVLGLYRYAHESKSEFKDWAADCPLYCVQELLQEWRSRNGGDSAAVRAMEEFIRRNCSSWIKHLLH